MRRREIIILKVVKNEEYAAEISPAGIPLDISVKKLQMK